MSTRSGKSKLPCLVPDVREKAFCLSPLSILAVGFSQIVFIKLRKFCLIPSLLTLLSWTYIIFCQMHFLCLLAFIFILYVFYYLFILVFIFYSVDSNWFSCVEPTLHSWHNSHMVIAYILFYVAGFSLLTFSWGLLHPYS